MGVDTLERIMKINRLKHSIVRHGEGEETVWKNGQGKSWSIGRSERFDGTNFEWSVSIAVMSDEREFSRYPGVDRTLSIIDGDGMKLRLGDREILLTQDSQPFAFDGEARVVGDVLFQRPVVDFNVLTLRSACKHSSRRIHLTDDHILRADVDVLIVHVHSANSGLRIECLNEELRPGDTLIVEDALFDTIRIQGEGELLISQVKRREPTNP